MADVIAIIVLADVMPNVVADVIANEVYWFVADEKPLWYMFNHLFGWLADGIATLGDGRCYCHCSRWNGHIGWNDFIYGRCYCLCGRWNSHWVSLLYFIYFCFYLFYLFILSFEMLNRTSSHMWGRWYLPIFLFRVGLLTLMYIDSFISLIRGLVLPPHYTEILHCSSMTCGVEMVINWGRGL